MPPSFACHAAAPPATARAGLRRLLGASALLAGLGGCSTPAPAPVDTAPLRAFAARGYAAVAQVAVDTSTHDWLLAGQAQRVVLMRPHGASAAPLVVYLPGLGEAPEAGGAWRAAWAGAGYVVLSVQALAEDAEAWQSELARAGDFKALGQRQYSGAAMTRRVAALAAVLAEAERRGLAGEAAWQGIAWRRRVVAGFDLGAYGAAAELRHK